MKYKYEVEVVSYSELMGCLARRGEEGWLLATIVKHQSRSFLQLDAYQLIFYQDKGDRMKIRTGFVANSSSSSFLIATKGELDTDKLKAVVLEALMVPKESPLQKLVGEMADVLANADQATIKDIEENWGYSMGEMIEKKVCNGFFNKAFSKGLTTFYEGSAGSDGDIAEQTLCEIGISYESDDLIIEKEAGY